MPLVSVILTCYNHRAFIEEACESIRRQQGVEMELIAIDDGSTDGTAEWMREHLRPEECIFNSENQGTYGSLNVGLKRAKGEFVAILNDDDFWEDEKLRLQLQAMEAHPSAAICHTGGRFVDEDGKEIDGQPLGFAYPQTHSSDILAELVVHNKIVPSSVLIRMTALQHTGFFDPSFYGCGDWQLFLRLSQDYGAVYIDRKLLNYRVHKENASRNTEKMDADDARIREWISCNGSSWLESRGHDRKLYLALAHNWACLGTIRTRNGDAAGGRRAYARSIRMLPTRIKSYFRWLGTFLPRKVFSRWK